MRRFLLILFFVLAGCSGGQEPVKTAWIVEACASSSHWDYNGGQITAEVLQKIAETDSGYRTVLFNHDQERPVGRILALSYCGDGKLRARIEISQTAPEVWRLIREKVLTGVSVSIHVWDFTFDYLLDKEKDIQVVTVADLIEISIVSLPANPDARIEKWYVIERRRMADMTEWVGPRSGWGSSLWFSSWLARLTHSTPVSPSTPPASSL